MNRRTRAVLSVTQSHQHHPLHEIIISQTGDISPAHLKHRDHILCAGLRSVIMCLLIGPDKHIKKPIFRLDYPVCPGLGWWQLNDMKSWSSGWQDGKSDRNSNENYKSPGAAALPGSHWDTLLRHLWNQQLFQGSPNHTICALICIILILFFYSSCQAVWGLMGCLC